MDYTRVMRLKAGQTFYGVNMAGGWATQWSIVRRDSLGEKDDSAFLVCRIRAISNPGKVGLGEDSDHLCWYRFSNKPEDAAAMQYTLCRGQALRWAEEAAREKHWRIKDELDESSSGPDDLHGQP